MSIGLTGAQGTGKTTLAMAYSESHQIPFCKTTTAEVFKRLGYSPREDYDFSTRLLIQQAILEEFEMLYQKAGAYFITDRTPIDMMAYTLADVTREPIGDQVERQLENYLNKCIEVCNTYFDTLIFLHPALKVVDNREDRAPLSYGYVQHFSALAHGAALHQDIQSELLVMPSSVIDLKERQQFIFIRLLEKSSRQHIKNNGFYGII